jgi:NAD(P)H-hydrate repair Nnr-like enzyme with NAD(P)H-hydrate epimerase domain
MPMIRRISLIALLGAAVVAGCGDTVIDDDKTEGAIEQNLESAAKKKVSSVDCPSDVDVEKGAKFSCTVNLDNGKTEKASLKILNDDADIELTGLKPAG